MATWIMHFRVADILIDHSKLLNHAAFLIGNIGPDCSSYDPLTKNFTPPSGLTHFTETGRKLDINLESFYLKYLSSYKKYTDNDFLFYLGYYVHLLTDLLWTKYIWVPTKEKYWDRQLALREFLELIRKDWIASDRSYLINHPEFNIYHTFSEIKTFDNHFLDFYEKDAFTKQIANIVNFYSQSNVNESHDLIYFQESMAINFLSLCEKEIIEDLLQKKLVPQEMIQI